jgi:hypothetical protein
MTAVPEDLTATVALRKPDGAKFDPADVEGLLPTTLLVVEIDARTVTDLGAGEPVITLGRVIGWIPPASAALGRTMLTAACSTINRAAQQIAADKIAARNGNRAQ